MDFSNDGHFKLSSKEIELLPKVWIFVDTFTGILKDLKKDLGKLPGAIVYRRSIIGTIREIYTPEEFYEYECILEKLFWNLLTKYKIFTWYEKNKAHGEYTCKIPEGIFGYRNLDNSTAHKMIYKIDNRLVINSDYHDMPEIIRRAMASLRSENEYMQCMESKKYFLEFKYVQYFYPDDYIFPNLNTIGFNDNTKEERIHQIIRLYYSPYDKFWYKNVYLVS